MTRLLVGAALAGIEVRIWYVGLQSPELHIARVRARASTGGHDIPDERIRERYDTSRLNLARLIPVVTEMRVYDNSASRDPASGIAPTPRLILHLERGRILKTCALTRVPEWVRPILAVALSPHDGLAGEDTD